MKRKSKKKSTPRKRSKHIHDLQEKLSIFNDDEGTTVKTKLLETLTLDDLYENYKTSDDTEFVPFTSLSSETKDGLKKDIKKEGNKIKDIVFDLPNNPLKVGDSHKHDIIPHKVFKKLFKKPMATSNSTHYLDGRHCDYLYQLDRYELWENFMRPILFAKTRSNTNLRMNFNEFVNLLQTETGFDVFTYGFNKYKFLHVIVKIDASDVFFVCCIFTLLEVNSKLADRFDQVIDKNYSIKNDAKFYEDNCIEEIEMELKNYYYFTCGCEK